MEVEVLNEESNPKKGRHRKKQLYTSILQQMEFYFSDSNLSKDRFLGKLLKNDPYVDINVFLQFSKIKKLTSNKNDVIKAIKKSKILSLSDDEEKICRITPIKVKPNVDQCTIYVEHIKADTTHEWVSSVFSEFGNVVYVSIPRYKHNKLNKGFAFVEFEYPHEAQKALEYFENIGCKMSSQMEPEQLCSIATYENDDQKEEKESWVQKGEQLVSNKDESGNVKRMDENESDTNIGEKRKREDDGNNDENESKKIKSSEDVKESNAEEENANAEFTEDCEQKKKQKHKKLQKRKAYFKELGLQILSKEEWKKMRNRYLNTQRMKMKQLKVFLRKRQFANNEEKMHHKNDDETAVNNESVEDKKGLEFVPGVIVKIKLPEPSSDSKKTKNEIKTYSSDVKYVDIPVLSGSEEVFVRFASTGSANKFLSSNFNGELSLLEGEQEQQYWKKINKDRDVKYNKEKKKQRGRDKLLKKAEKELGKHIRFDDPE